jgi:hypothetical protein
LAETPKEGAAEEAAGSLDVQNGLIMRQVPVIRKLQYDASSGDYLIYKRKKTDAITVEEQTKKDYESSMVLRTLIE